MGKKDTPVIKHFHFKSVLLTGKWLVPAYVGIDHLGTIRSVSSSLPNDNAPVESVPGIALPGFQNAHSHAFQYAMAGMAERHQPGTNDDFWSWREAMYRCASLLDPDQIQTVATALYIEMLKKGYTHVAEFHYVHHDKTGEPYANRAEVSVSLLAAAAVAGIKITLIPVFYQRGGFAREAQESQRRFVFKSVDEYYKLVEEAESVARNITTAKMGVGVHSLRAACEKDIIKIATSSNEDLPFHIHAAEQLQEVDDCVAHLKQRPVEWLLNNLPLSDRFNLVHCTHLNDDETLRLAKSKANVILCPGTEGNLGDGIFRLTDFSKHEGNWCIGTDSQISLNPLEDLRWLDYTQRLLTHKRNTFDDGGFTMLKKAFLCGSKAMGYQPQNFFEIGQPLDAAVFHSNALLLSDINAANLLSKILYTADSSALLGTIINGKWIVSDGYHHEENLVLNSFRKTMQSIG